jgi:hypothetical protein
MVIHFLDEVLLYVLSYLLLGFLTDVDQTHYGTLHSSSFIWV